MISDREALDLAEARGAKLAALIAEASARRDRIFGRRITFSPKVFLPLTNLCRNRCDYCSFRRSPADPGAHTMTPDEVDACLDRARAAGCVEALFCLGDTPETAFRPYRALLDGLGHGSTVDYLVWAGRRALDRGLLPHTNAGILSRAAMERLRKVNVSLGLMLENVSERLCGPGMPHHRAPDKRPARRIRMTREAGELRIAFTSGLLVGIGETRRERVETLLAIRALHAEHGHVQEVIVQPFRPHPATPMRASPAPDDEELVHAIALARSILPDDVSVQAPPNLSPASLAAMMAAGIDDLGGISPVTPDYINPRHPWPHLDALAAACAREGFELRPRLPVHDRFVSRPGFLDAGLGGPVQAAHERLARVGHPSELTPPGAAASEARP